MPADNLLSHAQLVVRVGCSFWTHIFISYILALQRTKIAFHPLFCIRFSTRTNKWITMCVIYQTKFPGVSYKLQKNMHVNKMTILRSYRYNKPCIKGLSRYLLPCPDIQRDCLGTDTLVLVYRRSESAYYLHPCSDIQRGWVGTDTPVLIYKGTESVPTPLSRSPLRHWCHTEANCYLTWNSSLPGNKATVEVIFDKQN